ncbi:MAG TPA: hypothetical protein PK079_07600 [Leptospiraceae bacterium]|nr:hypothetical protein [Leptospiraceae bacterium]HMW06005.1 hypothetical protein [Leptospiraceae bacterium]HMX34790.1 hypothetical protein [Leptospiraceae bacterium]HMY31453.1 hypothetical protein [Leptospiraceae bacterium]HMZ66262.1 hypothetical protein [Leptospiraceae bacterium]
MKKLTYILIVLAFISCGKKAEVTWDSALYSDPELTQKITDVKKGTVGIATGYRNHKWVAKQSIHMNIDGKEGYISPKHVVIGQNPAKSVFVWGYSEKYKKFFDPKDKKHYKDGYEFPDLAKLPKEKLPLDELVKDSVVE